MKRDSVRKTLSVKEANDDQPIWFRNTPPHYAGKQALIIGAGMAGAATARSLAERGWQVRMVDTHSAPAGEASGNPQGMLYIRLSGHSTVLSRFITQGYLYTLGLLTQLERHTAFEQTLWQKTGLIQLAFNHAETQRQQRIIQSEQFPTTLLQPMDAESLSSLAGLPLNVSGLYFPEAGWVHPPTLCHLLMDHPNIHFTGNSPITRLTHDGNQWLTDTEKNTCIPSDIVVIACGHRSSHLNQTQHLPLKSIRGQTTQLPATTNSRHLQAVVCSEGYIAPAWNGTHTLGATFNFNDESTTCRQQDHDSNLNTLATFTPSLYGALALSDIHSATLPGWVSFRCTTPDYLPVIGPVVNAEGFMAHFAALRKNANYRFADNPEHHSGLYINAGHGSRGLVTAPLSADILASYICGEPCPVSQDQRHALHPSRFMVRNLIKNRR